MSVVPSHVTTPNVVDLVPLSILIADDHRLLREGLTRSFTGAGLKVVDQADDGQRAYDLAMALRPDVVLMDVVMPRLDGIEATRRIVTDWPEACVVMLTMHDDWATKQRSLDAGAVGFVGKDCSFAEILNVVEGAVTGETWANGPLAAAMLASASSAAASPGILSARQIEILQLVADGMNTAQVGRRMAISAKTVNNQLGAIYRRLETANLTHAVLRAVRLGIVRLD